MIQRLQSQVARLESVFSRVYPQAINGVPGDDRQRRTATITASSRFRQLSSSRLNGDNSDKAAISASIAGRSCSRW
jgi:hypothetical protein